MDGSLSLLCLLTLWTLDFIYVCFCRVVLREICYIVENKNVFILIMPIRCQLPEERKLDLLKAVAEISPYTLPQDSRQILPSIVQLLKVKVILLT